MNYSDVFLLALALAVDAAVVSFSYGLVIKKNRLQTALKLAFATGCGQFLMPLIGWMGTSSVSKYIEHYDHWISFLVFLALGLNIISEALNEKEEKLDKKLNWRVLFMVGIATSIDACAAGITLYIIHTPILFAASIIGILTFICAVASFYASHILKKIPEQNIQIFSGIVLILLGTKVLWEHLFLS